MAKAIALYTGGIHARQETAVREDGVTFHRYQQRHPAYGYRWTAWKRGGQWGANRRANPPARLEAGFSTLSRDDAGAARRRLPND